MGTKLKYYKGKVKGKGEVALVPKNEAMLPIEYDFYKDLEPKVFMADVHLSSEERTIINEIKKYWELACFAAEFKDDILHNNYRGVYGSESIVETKESKLYQINIGKNSRSTHLIKVAPKSCQIVGDTAFVVFEQSIEYTLKDTNMLMHEDGIYCHTWVKDGKIWRLLGESVCPSLTDFLG